MEEIELPVAGGDWKAELRRCAISFHEALLRHRWAAELLLSTRGFSDPRRRYMNAVLGTLRQAGFSANQTDHAYHTLDSHIFGHSLWLVQMNLDDEALSHLAGDVLARLDAEALPYLVEHVHQHLQERLPGDDRPRPDSRGPRAAPGRMTEPIREAQHYR